MIELIVRIVVMAVAGMGLCVMFTDYLQITEKKL